MDLLDNFENDQRMLNELKGMLEFVSPAQLRRGLEDLFFNYLIEVEDPALPNKKEFIAHFYYLTNFLNEIEQYFQDSRT